MIFKGRNAKPAAPGTQAIVAMNDGRMGTLRLSGTNVLTLTGATEHESADAARKAFDATVRDFRADGHTVRVF